MQISIDKANIKYDGEKLLIDIDADIVKNMLFMNSTAVGSLKEGTEFLIGDEAFIVLEHTVVMGKKAREATYVIRKDFLPDNMKFGNNSNWAESPIRKFLNTKYYDKVAAIVGEDAVIETGRDLTSLDGLDDYGSCVDKISLLTASEYSQYHKILGLKSNYSNAWWTITPASTPSNGYTGSVCGVNSRGFLCWNDCVWSYGVRPFLILDSSTLVSLVKK